MYFVPSLVTCDLVALKFSPPATSACVSISHLGEAKRAVILCLLIAYPTQTYSLPHIYLRFRHPSCLIAKVWS